MDKEVEKLITLDGLSTIKLGIDKLIEDSTVTYTLEQDSTDGHVLIFTPSSGTPTTLTIPDNDSISLSDNNTYEALEV